MKNLTGLLLGAGASYECGMPMVRELTQAVRCIANPDMLRKRNERSRSIGLGVPGELVEELIELMRRDSMNYESIIGNMEVSYRRLGGHGNGQHYYGLSQDLTQLVYFILLDRHKSIKSLSPIYNRMIDGIVGIANNNIPLFIFSLNHHMIIEDLALEYKIPLKSGFKGITSLPLPKSNGDTVKAQVLTIKEISEENLDFFNLI